MENESKAPTTEVSRPKRRAIRPWAVAASPIVGFFYGMALWQFVFIRLGNFQDDFLKPDGSGSIESFIIVFGGVAFGIAAGWFVKGLVEGKSPRALSARLFAPVRGAVRLLLVVLAVVAAFVVAYLIFKGIAALPVSAAVILAALIIAGAIKK